MVIVPLMVHGVILATILIIRIMARAVVEIVGFMAHGRWRVRTIDREMGKEVVSFWVQRLVVSSTRMADNKEGDDDADDSQTDNHDTDDGSLSQTTFSI